MTQRRRIRCPRIIAMIGVCLALTGGAVATSGAAGAHAAGAHVAGAHVAGARVGAGQHAVTVPGGLAPGELPAASGDCYVSGVTCKPALTSSCTGNTSQSTAPSTIRVLVRTGSSVTVQTVSFISYVENVLPNEWLSSWDGEALKAGAVAVKSYGWYWVTHYGGYLGSTPSKTDCFDVTDDQDFQVYRANSATTRTNSAVLASWPVVARLNGLVMQASYLDYLNNSAESCGAYANGYQLSQWGTQNCNEENTANKYNVILGKYYYLHAPGDGTLQLATTRQKLTAHDFQFLQRSTRVTFESGVWSLDDGYPTVLRFGQAGDVPAVLNVGDGFARVGVFRPSTNSWYTGSPTGSVLSRISFGATGDVPVQAQYNGASSPTVIATWRPSTGSWYTATSAGAVATKTQWGVRGDIPVPGHYYGSSANDYADQLAVFRPSTGTWWIKGHASVRYGQSGDIPMPADYDANGTTDLAVYRPSTHQFFLRGHAPVTYGIAGDVPVTGDFTGDGRADLTMYRPSTHAWYVLGQTHVTFGTGGVVPIGKAPYHD